MWYDVTEDETLAVGFPDVLKDVWKKLKGQYHRIMLIIHLLKWAHNSDAVKISSLMRVQLPLQITFLIILNRKQKSFSLYPIKL